MAILLNIADTLPVRLAKALIARQARFTERQELFQRELEPLTRRCRQTIR
jgi:predicted lipid carrier protein YhbT